jgi:hypothetical protein
MVYDGNVNFYISEEFYQIIENLLNCIYRYNNISKIKKITNLYLNMNKYTILDIDMTKYNAKEKDKMFDIITNELFGSFNKHSHYYKKTCSESCSMIINLFPN